MNDDGISIDDDFLNLRFDPKFKQIFKEKIESLQGKSIAEDYLLPVNFVGSYSIKTQQYLNTMVSRVTKSAGVCGLRLRKSNPEIVFYTADAWSENKNIDLNLPASTITWQGSHPIIQVVTPSKIDSSEILIKTVRLLFSKLFGTLFFNENVLLRKPYFVDAITSVDSDFDVEEKLHFCRLQDEYPTSVLDQFKKLALNKRLSKDKLIESGKNEFFKLLANESENPNSLYLDLLNTIFLDHAENAKKNPQTFFNQVSQKMFETLPKLGLVLPHELRFYGSLEARTQWQMFDGIAEKAQYVKGCIEDLLECFDYFESIKSKELTDYSTFDYWINILNSRIIYLKRKGLVKLFLVDDSRLSLNQKKDMLEFPLWVWRQRIFENYPENLPVNKLLQVVTNHYKNSIYQKILEASFRAVNHMNSMNAKSKKEWAMSADYKRFCSLIAGLRVRVPIVNDVLHSSRIIPQMALLSRESKEPVINASSRFEQGWSYFISFALIHQFYLNRESTSNDKAAKFLAIIMQHLEKKLENKISFQISYLLLLIYLNSHYDLGKLISKIIDGSETLDYFILNISKINNIKISKIDIIKKYSDSILK